ncbi:MAG: conjugal transfer protein [Egibacteraceae bacterium]
MKKQGTALASPPPDVAERWLDDRVIRKRQPQPRAGRRSGDTPRRTGTRASGTRGSGTRASGGRWIVWAGRSMLWVVVAVILLLGIQTLLRPPTPYEPPPPPPAGPEATFPVQGAEAFAVRFASVYLEWDSSDPHARAERLAPYIPDGIDQQLGWAGNGRQVAVLVLPVQTVIVSDTAAVVTVAAEVTGVKDPRWIHLAVPVSADGRGRFVVTSTPTLVPSPAEAVPPREPIQTADNELTGELREPLTAFFRAYAGTEPGQLEYLLAPGVEVGILGGMVQFVDLQLAVPRGGDRRDVVAKVRWADPVTQSTFTQSYQVAVAKRQDGRWYIEQLGAYTPTPANPSQEKEN